MLAFTNAAGAGTLAASLFFFLAFFVGTSLYFVPLAFVGLMSHVNALRTVGKLAAVLMALYYAYTGVIYIAGGFVQL